MEAVKELWKRCKTYLKQLLCIHKSGRPHLNAATKVITIECNKCGYKHSFPVGRKAVKHKGMWV